MTEDLKTGCVDLNVNLVLMV